MGEDLRDQVVLGFLRGAELRGGEVEILEEVAEVVRAVGAESALFDVLQDLGEVAEAEVEAELRPATVKTPLCDSETPSTRSSSPSRAGPRSWSIERKRVRRRGWDDRACRTAGDVAIDFCQIL